jgi:phospholipid transport system substrate-binding protein
MLRRLLLVLCLVAVPAAHAAEPADTVHMFHDALLANMKSPKTVACTDRISQLGAVIDKTFDLSFIAQHVLRKRWDGLSDEQRNQFITTFHDLVVSTYVLNFSSYGGETFTPGETTDSSGGFRTVKTELKPADGQPVTFQYVLRNTADGWRIVNIIADGVSDLALRSTQYERAFQDSGFDGLVTQLHDQTTKNKAGC